MEKNAISKKLVEDFFGIEDQINQICDMIAPWTDLPDSYIRPLIVNLWGMTGTGKTSIVRKLAEILDIPLVELDLGEFVGDGIEDNFSKNFFEKYYDLSNKPCIILLDEFHIIRTLSEDEGEIDREKLRGLWSLLSDGQIIINTKIDQDDDFDYVFDEAIDDYNDDMFEVKRLEQSDEEDAKELIKKILNKNKFYYFGYGAYFLKYFCKVTGEDYRTLRDDLDSDFVSTAEKMKNLAKTLGLQPKLDYKKALIFISGNLDKIYKSVLDFDPDIDLESIWSHSKTLTVSDVKTELSERFRPEQIGRLGNNHIIYYALDKKSYIKIIKNDLKRISNFFEKREDIKIKFNFSNEVCELVYREGVVPAQGARSVLSTIGTLIEPKVIRFVINHRKLVSNPRKVREVKVDYDKKSNKLFFKGDKLSEEVTPQLNFDELRRPIITNRSVCTAVHEAGHVLLSCLRFGIIPNRASAFTVGNDKSGIVEFMSSLEDDVMYKDRYLALIEMCLAGVIAERYVFGVESLGCSSDIAKATNIALDLICTLDHNNSFAYVRKNAKEYDFTIERTDIHDSLVDQVIQDCTKNTENVLKDNSKLFTDLTNSLLENSFITKKNIDLILKNNKVKVPRVFSYVNSYEKFKKDVGGK